MKGLNWKQARDRIRGVSERFTRHSCIVNNCILNFLAPSWIMEIYGFCESGFLT